MKKTIIVTGANRGIGFEICRQLTDLGHDVLLTARSEEQGQKSADELGISFLQLDVSSPASIATFIQQFSVQFEALDVLVNNAGIFSDKGKSASNPDFTDIRSTMETNLLGPWQLIVGLLPLLKKAKDPRVINVSSGLGAMSEMGGGYPGYRLSKVGMNAMTRMLHSELGDQVTVNSYCPGWVKTDMGGPGATRPLEKGAETGVWLATASTVPNGKFLRDKEIIKW